MRSTPDRIRHAVSLEIVGLALIMLPASWLFGLHMHDTGVIGLAGSLAAVIWTYAFNFGFDTVLKGVTGRTSKGLAIRILHAVLFEIGLVIIFVPFVAWYLGTGFWHALSIDIGLHGAVPALGQALP